MMSVGIVMAVSLKMMLVAPVIMCLAFLYALMIGTAAVGEVGMIDSNSNRLSNGLAQDMHEKVTALIGWTGINTFN